MQLTVQHPKPSALEKMLLKRLRKCKHAQWMIS